MPSTPSACPGTNSRVALARRAGAAELAADERTGAKQTRLLESRTALTAFLLALTLTEVPHTKTFTSAKRRDVIANTTSRECLVRMPSRISPCTDNGARRAPPKGRQRGSQQERTDSTMTVRPRFRHTRKALLTLAAAADARPWRAAGRRRRDAGAGGDAGAVRHLRRRRHALRGRAQHHPGAVRRLQRAALPGPARVGQRHHEHRPAQRGRRRQRRGAGLLLRRHHLRHHGDLRPVRPRQQPHRRARRRRGRRPRQPRERHRGAGHGRRPQGLRRLHRRRHRLPRRQHQRHRHRRRPRGRVRHLRRHALQRRLLLRLRQRRDQQRRRRRRHHGSHLLRQHQGLGLRHRATARGSWPTWRTACSPASTPAPELQRPDHHQPVHHRHDRGRREPVGHPRRQRPVRRPVHRLQRRPAPRATTR